MEFEAGHTISHFRLEKKLGEGGMGTVYRAEDLTLSRQVAIKFMHRSLVAQQSSKKIRESLEKRFIREARSAAAINHPNLAQIYEANFDTDDWYIAMEYIDGCDLPGRRAEVGQFAVDEVCEIARQVLAGLRFAWVHHKILHRDIKPQNIMLTREHQVKIVDLGLAKPVSATEDDEQELELTQAGTAVGTPHYMAPEQAAGDTEIDCAVDIFSVGATLYELCTGHKAFNAKTAAMIYMSQMNRDYAQIGRAHV